MAGDWLESSWGIMLSLDQLDSVLQVFQAISPGSIRQRAEVAVHILFLIFPQPGLCWNIKHSIQLSGWALWGSPSSRVTFPKCGLLLPEGLNKALLQRGVALGAFRVTLDSSWESLDLLMRTLLASPRAV